MKKILFMFMFLTSLTATAQTWDDLKLDCITKYTTDGIPYADARITNYFKYGVAYYEITCCYYVDNIFYKKGIKKVKKFVGKNTYLDGWFWLPNCPSNFIKIHYYLSLVVFSDGSYLKRN